MNKISIKEGYNQLISNGDYTHAITLKPNVGGAAITGNCYRINADETKRLIVSASLTCAVTSNPIGGFSDNTLRQRLMKFLGRLDRRLLGSRFNLEKYDELRTQAFVIIEGSGLAAHLHGVLKVHDSRKLAFNQLFLESDTKHLGKQLWTSASRGGTVDVKLLYDVNGWADYMLKSLCETDFSDRIYITAK
jgi:hypothetical protein